MGRLISTATAVTGKGREEILRDFGEFIAPDLIAMYRNQLHPSWKTLELLEHTEETIHRLVRIKTPGAQPAELKTRREDANTVVLDYRSSRRMCALAKGILVGAAKFYGESIRFADRKCMLQGDPHCEIVVTREA